MSPEVPVPASAKVTPSTAEETTHADGQKPPVAEPELDETEVRCTICGLRACWTGTR